MQAAATHRQIAARLDENHAANGAQRPDAVSELQKLPPFPPFS